MVLAGAPTEVSIPAVEALVRWDPAWFAERELEERRELSPAARPARLAVLTGARPALEAATAELELRATASVLGPLPHGVTDRWRTLVTVARPDGAGARPRARARCAPGRRPARTPTRCRCASTRRTPRRDRRRSLRHLDSRA